MNQRQHKAWLSPLVAVLYSAVAMSGILMLFHLRGPGIRTLHEWGGILFLFVATIHLVFNWQIFISYMRRKSAVFGAGCGILIVAAMLLVGAQRADNDNYRSHDNRHLSGYSVY